MNETILVVDDEREIADLLEIYLKNDGYTVHTCATGAEALRCVESEHIDLALLDVMLPDIDGFSLCRKIRESRFFPILMLTARVADSDKILGLTIGADDYITKPFGMMELLSRVRALLRRTTPDDDPPAFRHGCLYVCPARHEVTVNNEPVALTLKEFKLLCLLLQKQGAVADREEILRRIWGYDYDGESRTVDVHVRTLRQKLGSAGAYIETVKGMGYKIGGLT